MKTIEQEVLFKKSNIDYCKGYHAKSKSNDCFCIDVFNISIFHSPPSFLNLYAKIKAIIAEIKFPNNNNLFTFGLFDHSGTITVAPIHPADKLTKNSDNVISQTGSSFVTCVSLAIAKLGVNQISGRSKTLRGAVG